MKLLIILSLVLGVAYAALNHRPVTTSTQEPAYSELKQIAGAIKERQRETRARASFQARVQKVESILKGTPMAEAAMDFVRCGDRYGINPSLLLAIAQHESNYGRAGFATKSNNAFGWNIHGGQSFDTWGDGVCTVAQGLAKSYDLSSVKAIIHRYAPPVENDTNGYVAHVERYIAANPI